jgi:hypothetical protein
MYSQLITLVAYRKMRLGKMRAEIDNQGDSDQKEKLQSVYHQYYADVMLPNGTPHLASTREAMCSILCPTVDDTNIHQLNVPVVIVTNARKAIFQLPKNLLTSQPRTLPFIPIDPLVSVLSTAKWAVPFQLVS